MKKSLVALIIALTVITGSSFANVPEAVNRNILSSFNRSYEHAQEVKWESGKNFVRATFKLNGKIVFAYYKETGEEIAKTRNLSTDELPEALRMAIRSKYGNAYWLTELFEVVSEQEQAYYAAITDGNKIVVYKADVTGGWRTYSRKKASN